MKSAFVSIISVLSLLSVALLESCQSAGDYTGEIKILDSILVKTADLVHTCDSSHAVVNANYPDSMLLMIQNIQNDYKTVMPHDKAEEMAGFTHTAQELLRLGIEFDGAGEMLIHYRDEVNSLKKALAEHATHDKAGNEINESYVALVMQKEQENLNQIVQHVSSLCMDLEQNVQKSKQHYPVVKSISNSLTTTTEAR